MIQELNRKQKTIDNTKEFQFYNKLMKFIMRFPIFLYFSVSSLANQIKFKQALMKQKN